ncbi:organic solute transporter subunit alpha-like [Tubulanus polymorphus]|uniref:organic solute transporter subunit alpha-like n=1 Tax=Tubulanus polymorphus TaxID=672921 RepID=UPI003DA43C6A
MENCSDTLPTTRKFFSEIPESELIGLCICMAMALFNLILFLEEVYRLHKRPLSLTRVEGSHPIWLLALHPVVSITALMTLCIPRSLELNKLVAALYLSISVIKFVDLMVDYLGGREKCIETLSHEKISLKSPPVCCICPCCPEVDLTRKNLMIIYGMVNQMVVLRPILLYAAGLMMADDRMNLDLYEDAERTYNILSYISMVSTLLAMWGLLMIYRTLRKHLQPQSISGKFICMQLVILFQNVQGPILTAIQSFGWIPCSGKGFMHTDSRSQNIQSVMLIAEMVLVGIYARVCFFRPVLREDVAYPHCIYGSTHDWARDPGDPARIVEPSLKIDSSQNLIIDKSCEDHLESSATSADENLPILAGDS